MAATSCRVPLLGVCRLFDRLRLSGGSVARFHSFNNHVHQVMTTGALQQTLESVHSLNLSRVSVQIVTSRGLKWYTDKRISGNIGAVGMAEADPDLPALTDETESLELAQKVNESLDQKDHGRLFAVVRIAGVQRKVTAEDVIVIEGYTFPPTVGDRLRLEKVLLVGGRDFTLIGQPMISRDQVKVEATVIEKTLSHNRVWSTYRRRKRFRKLKVFRIPQTMLVINSIELNPLPES
ncbi:hypothetical protein BaRGS_00038203 [Batillaria attramentaria]|uniref:Large ribosomal subunit protein bL21m n=1 Tax=Batillaria attramentaria TaxID=370345 RepID=A0ABD0J7A1_9CAEN